ncbi:MAG: biotin/lipoyl-containing protein, partial [Thermoplasmata archaeon]
TVRVGSHEWSVQVGDAGNGSVTFEILGERVEVRRDGSGNGTPGGSVIVNGEVHTLAVESSVGSVSPPPVSKGAALAPFAAAPSAGDVGDGSGRAVRPPMPGKVLEVRVRNGEKVRAGQVLLVVEAMKMRNEVTAPIEGEVSELHVVPGANVAAREVLLRVLAP